MIHGASMYAYTLEMPTIESDQPASKGELLANPDYCAWEGGFIVPKALDQDCWRVDFRQASSENAGRHLSISHLEFLSSIPQSTLIKFYGDCLTKQQMANILSYKAACQTAPLKGMAVAPAAATASLPPQESAVALPLKIELPEAQSLLVAKSKLEESLAYLFEAFSATLKISREGPLEIKRRAILATVALGIVATSFVVGAEDNSQTEHGTSQLARVVDSLPEIRYYTELSVETADDIGRILSSEAFTANPIYSVKYNQEPLPEQISSIRPIELVSQYPETASAGRNQESPAEQEQAAPAHSVRLVPPLPETASVEPSVVVNAGNPSLEDIPNPPIAENIYTPQTALPEIAPDSVSNNPVTANNSAVNSQRLLSPVVPPPPIEQTIGAVISPKIVDQQLSNVSNSASEQPTNTLLTPTTQPSKRIEMPGPPDFPLKQQWAKWLAAASIPSEDWPYVNYIITRESDWRPFIWNMEGSGAYGLCQAMLPLHEVPPGFMEDPVIQLRWCDWYAHNRYGSWKNAYYAWIKQGWW